MNIIDRYRELYSGVIYDALTFDLKLGSPFVLHHNIKPQWTKGAEPKRFGYAFTCQGCVVTDPSHIDDSVRIKMFKSFYSNCFQVIATGGDKTVAHFGDISGKIATKFGAIGAVTDGYTRDISIIEEDEFAIYAAGVMPIDAYGRWQITAYETPVVLDGIEGFVTVNPGDGVYADRDSVLIIPKDLIEQTCELAEARLAKEDIVRKELRETNDIEEIYKRVGRW